MRIPTCEICNRPIPLGYLASFLPGLWHDRGIEDSCTSCVEAWELAREPVAENYVKALNDAFDAFRVIRRER